jgi:hypothetical protein
METESSGKILMQALILCGLGDYILQALLINRLRLRPLC